MCSRWRAHGLEGALPVPVSRHASLRCDELRSESLAPGFPIKTLSSDPPSIWSVRVLEL